MRRLGAALAKVLRPGDTVLLGGELGAGKTTFTQGLAHALGVAEAVTSPTFVLLHSYRTGAGWDLVHADVWRLEQLQEVIDLGIPELQEEGAAVIVEWGELAAPALSGDCLHVSIDFEVTDLEGPEGGEGGERVWSGGASGSDVGTRSVVFKAGSSDWARRLGLLAPELTG